MVKPVSNMQGIPYAVQERNKPRKKKLGFLRFLFILSLIVFLACLVFYLAETIWNWHILEDLKALSDRVVMDIPVSMVGKVGDEWNPVGEENGPQESGEKLLTRIPYHVDFDTLQEINPEICGWIICPDTVIDYPVLQNPDNYYYLSHNYDNKRSKNGSIFIDIACDKNLGNTNTLIHGHRMRSGAMFGSLLYYAEQEYYEAHPVMYLLTPEKGYLLEIFSVYSENYDGPHAKYEFVSEKEYAQYLLDCQGKSIVETDVSVTAKDKIVTLSTCTRDSNNARLVVQAKLVPDAV